MWQVVWGYCSALFCVVRHWTTSTPMGRERGSISALGRVVCAQHCRAEVGGARGSGVGALASVVLA